MHEPGAPLCRSARKKLARIRLDALQPGARHAEDTHLLGGTEAILACTQDAEWMTAIALEGQDHVHEVLEHAGTRQGALLRDVPDQDECRAVQLRRGGEPRRALANLCDGAGGRRDGFARHRLNGVDEHNTGLRLAPGLAELRDARLGHHPEFLGQLGQPTCPQAQLFGALFAGHVQNGAPRSSRERRAAARGLTSPRPALHPAIRRNRVRALPQERDPAPKSPSEGAASPRPRYRPERCTFTVPAETPRCPDGSRLSRSRELDPGDPPPAAEPTNSSTRDSQDPHSGQRPSQRGCLVLHTLRTRRRNETSTSQRSVATTPDRGGHGAL